MRGVTWTTNNRRWRASLGGRYLGEFISFDEARATRRAAEITAFGEQQDAAKPYIDGETARVPVFNRAGRVVVWVTIEATDLPLVAEHRWCRTRSGYPVTRSKGRVVYLHRLLVPGDFQVDHRDRDKTNARRENLRTCGPLENARNTSLGKNNRTGFKGVSRSTNGRPWRSRIMVNRREIGLGRFDSAEEAARAYDDAAARFHGGFASPNFPDPQVAA